MISRNSILFYSVNESSVVQITSIWSSFFNKLSKTSEYSKFESKREFVPSDLLIFNFDDPLKLDKAMLCADILYLSFCKQLNVLKNGGNGSIA